MRQNTAWTKWPVRLLLVGLLLTVHLRPARGQDVPFLAKDINVAPLGSFPHGLTDVNGTLFFAASDPTHGIELWKSDGTAAGTVLVKDINPGGGSSVPGGLTDVNGTLFFVAQDPTHGDELWKSDRTAAGTVLVGDINPGSGTPDELTDVGGRLFFSAFEPNTGRELWSIGSCGNGLLDPGEGCDAGTANGTPESCCRSDCTLRPAGETCRPASRAAIRRAGGSWSTWARGHRIVRASLPARLGASA